MFCLNDFLSQHEQPFLLRTPINNAKQIPGWTAQDINYSIPKTDDTTLQNIELLCV